MLLQDIMATVALGDAQRLCWKLCIKNSDCNIKTASVSELLYRIGTDWMEQMRLDGAGETYGLQPDCGLSWLVIRQ